MPKPVLSDSLFNADDVATAIIESAELSVTNQDFAVADKTSIFTVDSNFSNARLIAYSFNGFMFLDWYLYRSGTPTTGDTLVTIGDSSFYPNQVYSFPSIGYEGDTVEHIEFGTDGVIKIKSPTNAGSSSWFTICNGWYRFS